MVVLVIFIMSSIAGAAPTIRRIDVADEIVDPMQMSDKGVICPFCLHLHPAKMVWSDAVRSGSVPYQEFRGNEWTCDECRKEFQISAMAKGWDYFSEPW